MQESVRLFIVFCDFIEKEADLPKILFQPVLNCGIAVEHYVYKCSPTAVFANPRACENEMMEAFQHFKPHLVLYSPLPYPHHLPYYFMELAHSANVPVMTIFWDTRMRLGKYELDLLLNTNYALVADSLASYYRMTLLNKLMHRAPTEFNTVFCSGMIHLPDDFKPITIEKQYDVLLLGSLEAERIDLVEKLKERLAEKNIRFNKLGGLLENFGNAADSFLSHEDYIRAVNAARILITSQTQPARLQIKNKVFEFLACGAFVLIDRNYEYESILPDDCVAYYSGFEDLVEKIEYYMAHPMEREALALKGHQWYMRTFNARVFWKDVIKAILQHRSEMPCSPIKPANPTLKVVAGEYDSLAGNYLNNSFYSLADKEHFLSLFTKEELFKHIGKRVRNRMGHLLERT